MEHSTAFCVNNSVAMGSVATHNEAFTEEKIRLKSRNSDPIKYKMHLNKKANILWQLSKVHRAKLSHHCKSYFAKTEAPLRQLLSFRT